MQTLLIFGDRVVLHYCTRDIPIQATALFTEVRLYSYLKRGTD